MDVLHLVTLNNTIINTVSKQIIEYNISTYPVNSVHFLYSIQGNSIAIHTLGTSR